VIRIEVANRSGVPQDEAAVLEICRRVLGDEGVDDGDLGVAFEPPERMRELKREHLGIDEATDVLSFPIDGRDPLPDDVPAPCWSEKHSIGFANDFYNAYVQRYGSPPPVNEWRFHDFGLRSPLGDLDHWWARIDREAAWSVAHGANMVLGAWGLLGWREPAPSYQEHLKQAMGRILNDPRINGAVYWSHEQWAGELHYLMNPDGTLTPEGQTYSNPLTDIPTDIATVLSNDGSATLRWTNTTAAWAAEAEFWVKAPGSDSFVLTRTERVPVLGVRETPSIAFHGGETVKGRVRYYNAFGQAGWSSFSDPVSIPGATEVTTKTGSRKTPRFCFLTGESC